MNNLPSHLKFTLKATAFRNLLYIVPVLIVLSLTFFTGCNEDYTVKSQKDQKFNFKTLKTYAWLPFVDSISARGVDHFQLCNAIASSIDDQFFKRGSKVDTINPDFLVRYSIMLSNSINVVSTPIYDYRPAVSYGYHGGYYGGYGSVGVYSQAVQVGTNVQQIPYRNGQLVIDVIDHKTNNVVWRGYAYGSKPESDQAALTAQMRSQVDKIVNDIFFYCPIKK
jgi:hypothetical protein